MSKRKLQKKKSRTGKSWNEADMEDALAEISAGSQIRPTSNKYGMSEAVLRQRIKKKAEGKVLVGSGRKNTLSPTEESDLAKCIASLCNLGFSPSSSQIKDFVKDYVKLHNMTTPFKNDRPGKNWLSQFMKRNNLSKKKANMICAARKSVTSNPFIIYDFYDTIEKLFNEKQYTPAQVRNCDESGFPTDPSRAKVIGPKGKVANKLTWGAGRENISTLAACSADGRVLDPLIIFSGVNFQSTWKGKEPLPNTIYGVSKNGWMTTDIFFQWFQKFIEQVEERPLLLIYDGHLSHVSVELIELAQAEDITLVKLPPHATDRLQPLDVCGFGPLKRLWIEELNNRVNTLGPKETISKATFVDLLSKVWHNGLLKKNMISGFRATGIVPLDRSKYPETAFDTRLLKRYNAWVELGKPEDLFDSLRTSTTTPTKMKERIAETSEPEAPSTSEPEAPSISEPTAPSTSEPETSTPTQSMVDDFDPATPVSGPTVCYECIKMGPMPPPVAGKIWVRGWSLIDASQCLPPASTTPTSEKSFEDVVLNKMKGPQEKQVKPRKKIDHKTKVITEMEYLAKLKKIDEEAKQKEEKRLNRKRTQPSVAGKRPTIKKKIKFGKGNGNDSSIEESTDEEEEESTDSDDENSSNESDNSDDSSENDDESQKEMTAEESLLDLWKSLSPPAEESDVIQKWYGCIYETKGKSRLYVGKAIRRFLIECNGPISAMEIECLKPHVGLDSILESVPEHLGRDIEVFPVHNIIGGPIEMLPLKNNRWNVPSYPQLKKKFEEYLKVDRKALFTKFQIVANQQ